MLLVLVLLRPGPSCPKARVRRRSHDQAATCDSRAWTADRMSDETVCRDALATVDRSNGPGWDGMDGEAPSCDRSNTVNAPDVVDAMPTPDVSLVDPPWRPPPTRPGRGRASGRSQRERGARASEMAAALALAFRAVCFVPSRPARCYTADTIRIS